MSPREKKLLTLFAVAGFVIVNMMGLSFYTKKSAELAVSKSGAERVLTTLELSEASRAQSLDQMEWLQRHMPEPADDGDVQTALVSTCKTAAGTYSLEFDYKPIKRDEGQAGHFQRVKIRCTLKGSEEALYRWLDRVNEPNQFRASTNLVLTPHGSEKTQIQCIAIVEQWYVPKGPST